jgi:hypothetical protein
VEPRKERKKEEEEEEEELLANIQKVPNSIPFVATFIKLK